MSRKFSEARKQAFLKALAESGNQTIAAERAKVSRSWVRLHRSTDPAFDADCRAAIAEAKESLAWAPIPDFRQGRQAWGARGSNRPPRGWGHLDGAELVVRGSGGSGGGRRVQIARARLRQWTPRVEDRFLAALAATCNVRAACAEAGMSVASAYKHRERWPGFARRWDAAVEMGCAELETALLEAAANIFSATDAPRTGQDAPPAGAEGPPAPAIAGMDAQQALHLLYMHKHYLPRPGRLPGRPPTAAPPGEVAAAIERGLYRLEQRRKRAARRDRAKRMAARPG